MREKQKRKIRARSSKHAQSLAEAFERTGVLTGGISKLIGQEIVISRAELKKGINQWRKPQIVLHTEAAPIPKGAIVLRKLDKLWVKIDQLAGGITLHSTRDKAAKGASDVATIITWARFIE